MNRTVPLHPHDAQPTYEFITRPSVPTVEITESALRDMQCLIDLSPSNEIGWLGSVQERPDNRYRIDRIFLFEQTVSPSHCEFDAATLGTFIADTIRKDPASKEYLGRLRFWGHLHPGNMTSPSGQDDDQMALFAHNPWYLRGIFTRTGQGRFWFFNYKDGYIIEDCEWTVVVERSARYEELAAEVQSKVTERVNRAVGVVSAWSQAWFGDKDKEKEGGQKQDDDAFDAKNPPICLAAGCTKDAIRKYQPYCSQACERSDEICAGLTCHFNVAEKHYPFCSKECRAEYESASKTLKKYQVNRAEEPSSGKKR